MTSKKMISCSPILLHLLSLRMYYRSHTRYASIQRAQGYDISARAREREERVNEEGAELRDNQGGPEATWATPRYTFRCKEAIERQEGRREEAENRVLVDEMGLSGPPRPPVMRHLLTHIDIGHWSCVGALSAPYP